MRLRLIPLVLVMPIVSGCLLNTGQFTASFDLPDPVRLTDANNLIAIQVDLNSVPRYTDHRGNLEDVLEAALVGQVSNQGNGDPIRLECWITRSATHYTLESEVRTNATRLWGPFAVKAQESRRIDWNDSAALVDPPGFRILSEEALGDGEFTLYLLDAAGLFDLEVAQSALVLVLDAGL